MTTLLVEELETNLTQTFNINVRHRINCQGVRLYAYCHNAPIGTFTLELIKDAVTLGSASFESSDIVAAHDNGDDYIHGLFLLAFDYPLVLNYGSYELKLSSSGYTFSESSYLGWVKRHEDLTNPIDYVPTSDAENPLTFELWDFERQG